MPKIKLTNRALIYIYDRFDDTGKNRRKRLHKSDVTEVSEGALRMLTKRGIRFDIVDGGLETQDEKKTEAKVEEAAKVEVQEVKAEEVKSEPVKKKVAKKKKKKKKKSTKVEG